MIRIQESDKSRAGALLPIGASIVIFRTPVDEILPLVRQLLDQGVSALYIVDNSPPGFDALRDWVPMDRVVTIATHINLGYGSAHNIAIRDSIRSNAYHLVCNPDITLADDTLEILFRTLEARPEVGLCVPKVVDPNGRLQHLCKRAPSPPDFVIRQVTPEHWFAKRRALFEMRDHSYDGEMSPEFMSGCFMFLRSSVLRKVGGFDEKYFLYLEDLDLSRRTARVSKNLYFPGTRVTHVHARGSHKSFRHFLMIARSALRYFNKFGWFEQPWFRVSSDPRSMQRD